MATVKATKREEIGSNRVQGLRKQGKVPGVVYGHGEESVSITLERHDIELALLHGERLLEMDLEGKAQNVLIKEVQRGPLGDDVLHVDLARVDLDERVEVTVALVLVGEPAGAKDGGVLQQSISEVTLECPVRSIPDEIRYLVKAMQLNDRLYLRDLKLPEGAALIDDPDMMVASVSEIAEEVAPAPTEGAPAEPEVIGAKVEEEGEEEKEKKEASE
jgi:large subunit ribosomal protein L25